MVRLNFKQLGYFVGEVFRRLNTIAVTSINIGTSYSENDVV